MQVFRLVVLAVALGAATGPVRADPARAIALWEINENGYKFMRNRGDVANGIMTARTTINKCDVVLESARIADLDFPRTLARSEGSGHFSSIVIPCRNGAQCAVTEVTRCNGNRQRQAGTSFVLGALEGPAIERLLTEFKRP